MTDERDDGVSIPVEIVIDVPDDEEIQTTREEPE